jgi:HD-GYP domain-containing protein (c-di-GMP phosphodiesterase class II)
MPAVPEGPQDALDEPWVHELAETLGNVIDAKDQHTWLHSEEVAEVSVVLALALGLGRDEASLVHIAGHLHDIGKVGVPDAVLLKPGPLTAEEFQVIKAHPVIGATMIRPVRFLRDHGVVDMVLHHHERFDGTGYPRGLQGEEIFLEARILAVCDVYEALTSHRPYRPAWPRQEAVDWIASLAGTAFDPACVEAFLAVAAEGIPTVPRGNGGGYGGRK